MFIFVQTNKFLTTLYFTNFFNFGGLVMKRFLVCFAVTAMILAVGCSRPQCSEGSATPCIDSANGLLWSEKVSGKTEMATMYCDSLNEKDKQSWRLPTADELSAIQKDGKNILGDTGCLVSNDGRQFCFSKRRNLEIRCVQGKVFNPENKEFGLKFSSPQKRELGTPVFCEKLEENGIDWRSPTPYEEEKFESIIFEWSTKESLLDWKNSQRCVFGKPVFFTDDSTGLIWTGKYIARFWTEAKTTCTKLDEGNFDDWRLPSIDELRTLIINCPSTEFGGSCQIINDGDFGHLSDICSTCKYQKGISYSKLGDSKELWSSSIASIGNLGNADMVWSVDFSNANISYAHTKYNTYFRCVRGENKLSNKQQKQLLYSKEKLVESTPTNETTKQEPKNSGAIKELNWSEKASEKMFARDAIDYCENLSENGHNDWRLPTIGELRTLIQNCEGTETGGTCGVTDTCLSQNDCKNKACDGCEDKTVQHSKLGDKGLFWSSSFRPESSNNAWYIDFTYASVHGHSDGKKLVRCVRNAN